MESRPYNQSVGSSRSVSEYSEIVFQKHDGLCATWNQATTCSTKSDYSDTLLAGGALHSVFPAFRFDPSSVLRKRCQRPVLVPGSPQKGRPWPRTGARKTSKRLGG